VTGAADVVGCATGVLIIAELGVASTAVGVAEAGCVSPGSKSAIIIYLHLLGFGGRFSATKRIAISSN
jgi:hypothetical protein